MAAAWFWLRKGDGGAIRKGKEVVTTLPWEREREREEVAARASWRRRGENFRTLGEIHRGFMGERR